MINPSVGSTTSDPPIAGTELFFGLVGPIGTDLTALCQLLIETLASVAGYDSTEIRLIRLLEEFDPWKGLSLLPDADYYDRAMTAGDTFRQQVGRGDALAILGMRYVQQRRIRAPGGSAKQPLPRHAYILRSLKHPEEVQLLRRTYGGAFVLIGAYAPRLTRLENLARKIAGSEAAAPLPDHRQAALRLLDRDENEAGVEFGQQVRDTFPMSDVFIDVSQPRDAVVDALVRFLKLAFGHPYITPTKQEQGMFYAQAAALRSSAMGRQVGAALCTDDGSLLAASSNEVPKAFGGQYWSDDPARDWRDFQLGYDSNDDIKRRNLAEVLRLLQEKGWLEPLRSDKSVSDLVDEASPLLKGARIMSPIEYGRAVHAEMSAIVEAGRQGISTDGATLFVTTFPCHECARHILAAGIKLVYFIEPYPKSLAGDLHKDAIALEEDGGDAKVPFRPFVGVAPRLYMLLFSMRPRKGPTGQVLAWDGRQSIPLTLGPSSSYCDIEDLLGADLGKKMQDTQLTLI